MSRAHRVTWPREMRRRRLYARILLRRGLELSERKVADGGFAEYFDKDAGLLIDDPVKRAQVAILLENAQKWLRSHLGVAPAREEAM